MGDAPLPPRIQKKPYDISGIRKDILALKYTREHHIDGAVTIDELLFLFTKLKGVHSPSTKNKLRIAIKKARSRARSFDDWRKIFWATRPYFKSNHADVIESILTMEKISSGSPQEVFDLKCCLKELSQSTAKEYVEFLKQNPRFKV